MGQARIHGPGDVRLDPVPPPHCGARDAIVEVHACGICGTDLSYLRLGGLAGPSGEPMALGHEFAGIVSEVGDAVSDVSVGQRVIVHPGNDELGRIGNGAPEGGLDDAVLVRDAARGGRLFPIPDDMPLDIAALAECVAVGMHAAEQLGDDVTDKVAVFGCGPVGLAAIAALADWGVTDIVGIDLSSTRRALAESLGAAVTIDPVGQSVWRELEAIHGTATQTFGTAPQTKGYVEASGADKVLTAIVDRAARGSRLSVVALHYTPVPINFVNVIMRELTIRGSMEYPERFGDAIDLLGRRDFSSLITDRFTLEDVGSAFELLQTSKECGKVMIDVRS